MPCSPHNAHALQSGDLGFFLTCDDAVCTNAVTRTPFASGQCLVSVRRGRGSLPRGIYATRIRALTCLSLPIALVLDCRLIPRSMAPVAWSSSAAPVSDERMIRQRAMPAIYNATNASQALIRFIPFARNDCRRRRA